MPKDFGAGQLIESIAFDRRGKIDDGFGNTVSGPWEEQFTTRAKFIQVRGGETVMAARLQSRSTYIIQVRISDKTRAVTPDWQIRDTRRGTEFNIREIHADASRSLFEMLAESNVATG